MDKIKNSVKHYAKSVADSKTAAKVTGVVQDTWRKRYGKFFIIAVLLGAAYFAYGFLKSSDTIETVVVHTGGTDAVVSVQGTVEAARDVELGFEGSGKVAWVGVKVGDSVKAGHTLATLSQGDLSAQITSLVALRDAAKAKLDDLKRGARPEEITIAESQVASAQTQVDLAQQTLADTLNDAYTKFDDAVRSKTDSLFSNAATTSPQFSLQTDSALKVSIENERASLQIELMQLQSRVVGSPTVNDAQTTKALAIRIRTYLDMISSAVNLAKSYTSLSQAEIDGYKSNVSSARTSISGYITTLSAAQTSLSNYTVALATAKSQLAQKKSGSSAEEVRAQEAQLRAAQANIAATQALASKKTISAPFSGLITKVDLKVGSISSSSDKIALISNNQLQMETYIPEVYIAKIAVGDTTEITLDAYGSQSVFTGKVGMIEPSSTLKDGVSTYKVVIGFDKSDSKIRPGMGGDIKITGTKGVTVITIPKKSIIQRNGKNYIQVPSENNKVIEREIVVSKFNEADNAEVIEGLSDGDVIVVTPIK